MPQTQYLISPTQSSLLQVFSISPSYTKQKSKKFVFVVVVLGFFGGTGVCTQDVALQTLYHLSHAHGQFCFSLFFQVGSCTFAQARLQLPPE
jgi:hypothetical protein